MKLNNKSLHIRLLYTVKLKYLTVGTGRNKHFDLTDWRDNML